MTHRRDLLPVNKLGEFQEFCESLGWTALPTKGLHEVLRMRHPDKAEPMIVHKRDYNLSGEPVHQREMSRLLRRTLPAPDRVIVLAWHSRGGPR